MQQTNAQAYQLAAASGATQIGLLVLVYDAIARDLIAAAQAAKSNDIEDRCAASRHALLLIAHLESWTSFDSEPALATSLHEFYAMLRTRILQLGAKPEASGFEQLAQLVFETRASWQSKEQSLLRTAPASPPHAMADPYSPGPVVSSSRTASRAISFQA